MTAARRLTLVTGWLVLALLLAPLAWAAWVSFSPDDLLRPPAGRWSLRWYAHFFRDARWTAALGNSLLVAAGATLVALAAGAPAALAARGGGAGAGLLRRAVLLPLLVPPVVLGMGLLPTMHALGLWGTPLALIFGHGLLGLPLVFLAVQASLAGVPAEVEDAARGLGAGPGRVLWRVTLPLCRPGLLAGAGLSFVVSLNEFFVALFLATPATETLPRVIWPDLRYSVGPLVAVASVLGLVAAGAGCVLALRLARGGPSRF